MVSSDDALTVALKLNDPILAIEKSITADSLAQP